MKIKKGDQILIIKGKDKGRKGKIVRVNPDNKKIVVEGLNLRKKHVKPKKQGEKGQIVEIAYPLPAANVKLLCPSCQKATRVGYKLDKDKKYRICQKCKQTI